MQSVYLIPCFISIILLAFALKSRFKIDSAFAPIAAIEALSLLLVIFGVAGILKVAALTLLLVSAVFGVYCIVKDAKGFLSFLSSPAVIAFVLASALLWVSYEIHDAFYFAYDEYSHWGPFFKGIFTNDCLHIYSSHSMFHPTYPQAVQTFYYYLSSLSPKFTETDTFIAMGVVISAGVSTMLYKASWKKPIKALLTIAVVPLFLALFPYCDAYISVYFDAILGVVFGACAIMAVTADPHSVKDTVLVSLGCMMLSQMKANGFLFSLICIALLLIKSLLTNGTEEKPLDKKARFLPAATALVSTLVIFAIWKLALLFTGNNLDQFNQRQFGGFFDEVSAALAGNNERVSLSWQNFVSNFKHTAVAVNGYGTVFLLFALMTCAAVVFGIFLWRKKKENGVAFVIASMPFFCLCYLFSIFYTYVCYMNATEAITNASYQRYVSTFYIGWLMLLVAVFFIFGDEFLSIKGKPLFPCLVSLALLALIAYGCLSRDVLNMKQTRAEVARPALDNICADVADAINDDEPVILLFNNDIIYVHIFRYFCFEENITLELRQSLDGMSRGEMAKYLSENSVKHAVVYILSDEFIEENCELFSDELEYFLDTECPCVYEIVTDANGVRFILKAKSSV